MFASKSKYLAMEQRRTFPCRNVQNDLDLIQLHRIHFISRSESLAIFLVECNSLIGQAVELLSAKVLGGPPFLLLTGSAHAHLNLPSWVS